MIKLPAFRELLVQRYRLFPGSQKDGRLQYNFKRGVNAIIGVNGLGKTTLLNILFRSLTGPSDLPQAVLEGDEFGYARLETRRLPNLGYFSRRVEDEAAEAEAEVLVTFGDRSLRIRRRLKDLSLVSLELDGTAQSLDEAVFQRLAGELSGFSSFTDYVVALRYLIFLFEDRQPLLWDGSAQRQIFRILFENETNATQWARLENAIQSADSQARNVRVQLNREKDKLKKHELSVSNSTVVQREIQAHTDEYESLTAKIEDLERALRESVEERDRQRLGLERAKIHRDDAVRDVERLKLDYFGHVFPDINKTAQYVFVHLQSGGGCLVCGSRAAATKQRFEVKLAEHVCPVCDSEPEEQERVVPPRQVADTRLAKAEVMAEEAGRLVDELAPGFEAVDRLRFTLLDELGLAQDKLKRTDQLLVQLRGRLPAGSKVLSDLRTRVEALQSLYDGYVTDRVTAENELKAIVDANTARVSEVSNRIVAKFAEYAAAFIAEKCELKFENAMARPGQEGQAFSYARFTVRMSSGTFNDLHRRPGPNDVSESQREFLDLSFRMALIDVVVGKGPAMLVLETPEASLDTVFMRRAGSLLANYANRGADPGNVLIVTSNLNGSLMIPALFGRVKVGVDKTDPPVIMPLDEVRSRIVKLTTSAAENQAIRDYHRDYDQDFEAAIAGDFPA